MVCTHIDVEETVERCSGIISRIEEIDKELGCIVCSSTATVEVCLECNNIYCRDNYHIETHWKESWHRNYFVPVFGTVSCEECAEYVSIYDINRMLTNISNVSTTYHHLSMNWVKGFLNLKRTCYMSSLLQSILSMQEFVRNFLEIDHTIRDCAITDCIICSINSIIRQMYSSTDGYVDISELIRIFWNRTSTFARSDYQDVQEFFIFLGNQIHSTVDCSSSKCPIHRTFGGIFCTSIECVCGKSEEIEEVFTSVSMNIFGNSLEDSITNYFNRESISMYKECSCGNMDKYSRSVRIKEMPRILCIHLKRYEIKNKQIVKIGNILPYPDVLEIEGKKYNLLSIIMHSGEIDSGHYIAYTRRNSQWYLTNDEEIMRVSLVDVLNKPVYILFYVDEEIG